MWQHAEYDNVIGNKVRSPTDCTRPGCRLRPSRVRGERASPGKRTITYYSMGRAERCQ